MYILYEIPDRLYSGAVELGVHLHPQVLSKKEAKPVHLLKCAHSGFRPSTTSATYVLKYWFGS